MSSLGDLPLAHSKAQNKSDKVSESVSCDDRETIQERDPTREESRSSLLPSKDHSHPSSRFSENADKNDIEESQIDANSTDDLVRGLLDPNDRPKDVWHVVEGPKLHPTIDTTSDKTEQPQEGDNIGARSMCESGDGKSIPSNVDESGQESVKCEGDSNGSRSLTRFKWTKEKSQVALNLVKHGCKPKLISIAVGCSLRTAQKFVETVTPKMEGESFKTYEIRRRGRKSKDVNQRLDAIREFLSQDSTKTQVSIAADLKVSNTTVCRDLKRLGASWREKKSTNNEHSGTNKRETKRGRRTTNNKKLPTSNIKR